MIPDIELSGFAIRTDRAFRVEQNVVSLFLIAFRAALRFAGSSNVAAVVTGTIPGRRSGIFTIPDWQHKVSLPPENNLAALGVPPGLAGGWKRIMPSDAFKGDHWAEESEADAQVGVLMRDGPYSKARRDIVATIRMRARRQRVNYCRSGEMGHAPKYTLPESSLPASGLASRFQVKADSSRLQFRDFWLELRRMGPYTGSDCTTR